MFNDKLSRRDWLKASAASTAAIVGGMAGLGSVSKVFAHDGMARNILSFSLEDVGICGSSKGDDRPLVVHPRTGNITTQNERRAMVEVRTYIGVWRALRNAHRLAAASSADVRSQMSRHLHSAESYAYSSVRQYDGKSMNVFKSPDRLYQIPNSGSYAWKFPGNCLRALQRVAELNLAGAEKIFEPSIAALLGLKIKNGVSEMIRPKFTKVDDSGEERLLGAIPAEFKYRPLTEKMLATLDELERSHTAWVQALKDNAKDGYLDVLVRRHHRQHEELEFMARDHTELTLLALQHHMHDVDRRWSKAQIDRLADRSNAIHKDWLKAVKGRDMRQAWLTGLNHSKMHIMLGYRDAELSEL